MSTFKTVETKIKALEAVVNTLDYGKLSVEQKQQLTQRLQTLTAQVQSGKVQTTKQQPTTQEGWRNQDVKE